MLGPPVQGAMDAAWTRRELPAMSVARQGCGGCVLSDGRFAVFGGHPGDMSNFASTSSCEALVVGTDEHWTPLPPMHDERAYFACAAVAECIIVAGGFGRTSAEAYDEALGPWLRLEVYDEALGQWLRLPCNLPSNGGLWVMGSTLI
jgi:hypothetical protein